MTSLTLKDAALGLSINQQTWAASGTVEMNSTEGYTTNLLVIAEPDTVEIAYCNTQHDPSEIPSSAWTVCDGAIPITIAETPADRYYTYIRFRSEVGRIIIKVDYAAVVVDDTYTYNESPDHKIRVYSAGEYVVNNALSNTHNINEYIQTAGTVTLTEGIYTVSGEEAKIDANNRIHIVYGIDISDIPDFPSIPYATPQEYVAGRWSWSDHQVSPITSDKHCRVLLPVTPGVTYNISCSSSYRLTGYLADADMYTPQSEDSWALNKTYTPIEGQVYLAVTVRRMDGENMTTDDISGMSAAVQLVSSDPADYIKISAAFSVGDPVVLPTNFVYFARNGRYAVMNWYGEITAADYPQDVTVYTYFGGTAAENLIATIKFDDLAIIEPTPSGSDSGS